MTHNPIIFSWTNPRNVTNIFNCCGKTFSLFHFIMVMHSYYRSWIIGCKVYCSTSCFIRYNKSDLIQLSKVKPGLLHKSSSPREIRFKYKRVWNAGHKRTQTRRSDAFSHVSDSLSKKASYFDSFSLCHYLFQLKNLSILLMN